jgi:Ca2+-transporting ATPase
MSSDAPPPPSSDLDAATPDDPHAPLWHAEGVADVLARLESSEDGLTSEQVAQRLALHGPNVLPHSAGDGPLKILWRQINNPLIWVLLVSAAVAIALGKPTDGLVVLAVVVINSIIGFVQEHRASRAIEALRDMVPEFASAMRDGLVATVPLADLVPGDVITLSSGDKIPADARLIQVNNLRLDEAALTGESVPVYKRVTPVEAESPLGDRACMAYGGTLVVFGTAAAVVVTTGLRGELGRISDLIREADSLATPLTRKLAWLANVITVAIIAVTVVILAFGVFRAVHAGVELGAALRETLVFAIALAVGAIPEGLPAVVTIALALGVRRMAARGAIIRKLPAVETLGSTTVICSDKTGTLTRNEMTVKALWTPADGLVPVEGVGYEPTGGFGARDGDPLPAGYLRLLEDAALCNDATLTQEAGRYSINGDPTEGALVVVAEKAGVDVGRLRERVRRIDAIPFESENQYMATLHEDGQVRWVVLKGAPETVIEHCKETRAPGDEATVRVQSDALAAEGMRVLAVAAKPWADEEDAELTEATVADGMSFSGLIGMIDPPRAEAIEAIRACHRAGIEVKMITGDHRVTAQAIGDQLGLSRASEAIEGKALRRLDEAALRDVSLNTFVFARVAPEQKLLLVRALQSEGQVVAMTGDGVNDAPALKQADVGVAMGLTGTSVSKEAADVVLTDDNFATIVVAVEEGRRVYDNLVKSLAFLLPTNLGLALILMYAVVLLPFDAITQTLLLPIRPTQLLWINLVAAVALALPLAFEVKEPNTMQRPPRPPTERILSSLVVRRTIIAAILMAAGALWLFRWQYTASLTRGGTGADSLAAAQTMVVTAVIMFQVFYMLECRSLRDSIFHIGVFSNPVVFIGSGVTLALQAAFIYAPPLQDVFGSVPLDASELGVAMLAGLVPLPIITLEKWIARRWRASGAALAASSSVTRPATPARR